jgi:hypothetical protein
MKAAFPHHSSGAGSAAPQRNLHPGTACQAAPDGDSTLSRFRHLYVPDYGLFAI